MTYVDNKNRKTFIERGGVSFWHLYNIIVSINCYHLVILIQICFLIWFVSDSRYKEITKYNIENLVSSRI